SGLIAAECLLHLLDLGFGQREHLRPALDAVGQRRGLVRVSFNASTALLAAAPPQRDDARRCGCRHGRPDRRRNGLGTISARDGGSWVELLSSRLSCPRWWIFGRRSALPFSGRGRGQTPDTRPEADVGHPAAGQGALGKA